MRGLPLAEITIRSLSVAGDRRSAFVLKNSRRQFPWLTAREFPELLLYSPYFVDPSRPETSEIRVRTPEGKDFSIDSAELLDEIASSARREIFRLQLSRGAYDGMPVSLVTLGSLQALTADTRHSVDPRRFRQNVLIETWDRLPHQENDWINGLLTFGDQRDSARLVIVRPDARCMIINLDPDTVKQTPDVLRTVVSKHARVMGVYGSPAGKEGKIRVGDMVFLTVLE